MSRPSHYTEIFPRTSIVFMQGPACDLCGLSIPPCPERYVCRKHESAGWCFTVDRETDKVVRCMCSSDSFGQSSHEERCPLYALWFSGREKQR